MVTTQAATLIHNIFTSFVDSTNPHFRKTKNNITYQGIIQLGWKFDSKNISDSTIYI